MYMVKTEGQSNSSAIKGHNNADCMVLLTSGDVALGFLSDEQQEHKYWDWEEHNFL